MKASGFPTAICRRRIASNLAAQAAQHRVLGRSRPSARWGATRNLSPSWSSVLLDWTHLIEKTNKQWAENARAYHRYVSRNDLCLTHALTDQYYDRTKRVSEQEDPDLILHIVGETKEGPVVRGLAHAGDLGADLRRSSRLSQPAARAGRAGLCDRVRDSDEHARA